MTSLRVPRCGIVGAGRSRNGLGPFLARDLEAAGAQVVAIAGRHAERTRALAEEMAEAWDHEVAACRTTEEMLESSGLDALVIAAPIAVHRPALEAALEARVAVLCEKPLVSPEEHAAVGGLLDGFAERGLLVMENCQWPYMLGVLDELLPGLRQQPVERIEMLVSPIGRGRHMLVDSLSHFLSVIQHLVPVDPSTRLLQPSVSDCQADTESLELTVELESPFPQMRSTLYLRRCAVQPRPAWVAVNGERVERRIRPRDYSISFSGGGRTVGIEDPLTALVRQFVVLLREPDLERARAEACSIRERARLYRAVFEAWEC